MLTDSSEWQEWSTLSKKEQIKRIAWQVLALALLYAGLAWQLLSGAAFYGPRDNDTFYLQDHPIPFCIVIFLQMILFAGVAFASLRQPLLKGWQKGEK